MICFQKLQNIMKIQEKTRSHKHFPILNLGGHNMAKMIRPGLFSLWLENFVISTIYKSFTKIKQKLRSNADHKLFVPGLP